jgi:Pyridoxamine 5'-phosphate oxidase
MSVPVELSAVRAAIAEHGRVAYLLTVNDDATPHVVSVEVTVTGQDIDGDRLVVGTGRRTRANLERATRVTLLWPAGPDPAYSLIVDATVASLADDGATAALAPSAAVLHRVVGAAGEGPNCVPVTGA